MNVGFFSYLLACAGYLILSALLLVSWRGRALGSFAIGASFCTAIWSGISAASTILEGFNPGLLLLGYGAWLAYDRISTERELSAPPTAQ